MRRELFPPVEKFGVHPEFFKIFKQPLVSLFPENFSGYAYEITIYYYAIIS